MNMSIRPLIKKIHHWIASWSVRLAAREQNLSETITRLRAIIPDISAQYSYKDSRIFVPDSFWEKKLRLQHAFQTSILLRAVKRKNLKTIFIADIGDSSGTHMQYISHLSITDSEIKTVSVNLDSEAVKKIQAKGMKALCKRAEEITPDDVGGDINIFSSFEMLEHLHNPALFLHNLAKKHRCDTLVLTVPYQARSRVGLHYIRSKMRKKVFAEDTHIFELCPEDWELLCRHSGWKPVEKTILFQYPRVLPLFKTLCTYYWRSFDYEGFLGLILEKDTTWADLYQDWGK